MLSESEEDDMLRDVVDIQARRREMDARRAAARRARARETGTPMGHGVDTVLVEALALLLAGRDADSPARQAYMSCVHRVLAARGIGASPELAARLQARLSVSSGFREREVSRRAERAASSH